jgi:hypothetical protein
MATTVLASLALVSEGVVGDRPRCREHPPLTTASVAWTHPDRKKRRIDAAELRFAFCTNRHSQRKVGDVEASPAEQLPGLVLDVRLLFAVSCIDRERRLQKRDGSTCYWRLCDDRCGYTA